MKSIGLKDIIFGKRAVFEAIENDIQIDKIFMDRDSQYMDNIKRKIIEKKIKISFVPIEKLNKLSKNNHQGIVASISPVKTLDIQDLENSIEKKATRFLILDNITDTKNYLYWHMSGFVEWELNKNTNLLTKKTTFADVLKSRTFACKFSPVEEKKIDELIKK